MKPLLALCYAGFCLGMFFYLCALINIGTVIAMIAVDIGHACMLTTIALLLLRQNPLNEPDPLGPLVEWEGNPSR